MIVFFIGDAFILVADCLFVLCLLIEGWLLFFFQIVVNVKGIKNVLEGQ